MKRGRPQAAWVEGSPRCCLEVDGRDEGKPKRGRRAPSIYRMPTRIGGRVLHLLPNEILRVG
jgi:hypothetical protein